MAQSDGRSYSPFRLLSRQNVNQNWLFIGIILTALVAFEMFNFSTTEYALSDVLGNLKFIGIPWSTILAIAFCCIDFAGIARLFTPQQDADEPKEIWYLFGAWLLAATMNAILTWWGISMAILSHNVQSISIMDANTLTRVVPVFVAIMVWLIRILIIGTLAMAGDRLIHGVGSGQRTATTRGSYANNARTSMPQPISAAPAAPRPTGQRSMSPPAQARPEPVYIGRQAEAASLHPEPTYHSVTAAPRPAPRPRPSAQNTNSSLPRRS
ncbi:MAG TPA: hypothetical protein VLH85_06290 [Levilinea sp.]|nr:hypothetical protein [Levilinea sp.]